MISRVMLESKTVRILELITYFNLCIILLDISFSGFGHWARIGTISLRMLCGVIAVLCSCLIGIYRIREWIHSILFLFIAMLGVVFLFSTYIGLKNSNTVEFLVKDLRGFSWFALIVPFFASCNTQKRTVFLMLCLVLGGIFQSIVINLINLSTISPNSLSLDMFSFVDQTGFGFINHVGNGLFRIFFRSNIYLIITYLLIIYLVFTKTIPNFTMIFLPLIFFSIIITYTRSTYLAFLITTCFLIVTIFLKKIENKFRLYKIIIFSILLSLAYVSIVQVTSNNNYVNFAIQRTLSSFPKLSDWLSLDTSEIRIVENPYIHDTIVSDQLRSTTSDELYALIRKSPIWGNGFGSSVVSRPGGLVEYFFLDLLAKTGVIGLIIYILPFCYILIRICNNHYKDKYLMITLFSGLIAFFVASYFNPYMNSALGITYYIFVISVDQIQIENN